MGGSRRTGREATQDQKVPNPTGFPLDSRVDSLICCGISGLSRLDGPTEDCSFWEFPPDCRSAALALKAPRSFYCSADDNHKNMEVYLSPSTIQEAFVPVEVKLSSTTAAAFTVCPWRGKESSSSQPNLSLLGGAPPSASPSGLSSFSWSPDRCSHLTFRGSVA